MSALDDIQGNKMSEEPTGGRIGIQGDACQRRTLTKPLSQSGARLSRPFQCYLVSFQSNSLNFSTNYISKVAVGQMINAVQSSFSGHPQDYDQALHYVDCKYSKKGNRYGKNCNH